MSKSKIEKIREKNRKEIEKLRKNNEEALQRAKKCVELCKKYEGVSVEEIDKQILNKIAIMAEAELEKKYRQKGKSESDGLHGAKKAINRDFQKKIDTDPEDVLRLKGNLEEEIENIRKRLEIERQRIKESIRMLEESEKQKRKLEEQKIASARLAGQKVAGFFKKTVGKIKNLCND